MIKNIKTSGRSLLNMYLDYLKINVYPPDKPMNQLLMWHIVKPAANRTNSLLTMMCIRNVLHTPSHTNNNALTTTTTTASKSRAWRFHICISTVAPHSHSLVSHKTQQIHFHLIWLCMVRRIIVRSGTTNLRVFPPYNIVGVNQQQTKLTPTTCLCGLVK